MASVENGVCEMCGETRPKTELIAGKRGAVCQACIGEIKAARAAATLAATWALPGRAVRFLSSSGASASVRYFGAPAPGEASASSGQSLRELIDAHLGTPGAHGIITASRTYPPYARVDLNRTLDLLLPRSEVACVGLPMHGQTRYAQLVGPEFHMMPFPPLPLQFEDVDIGEDSPARCLQNALWFARGPAAPHLVLLMPNHGPMGMSWQVEIVVPPGPEGHAIADRYFAAFDDAQTSASSYRGKILSFENDPRMPGARAPLTVHRLAPVARDEVILPAKTLALLERNVFRFAAHRDALRAMGLPLKKGLLFYGPPGTGKTHTVRYLAAALPGHTTFLVTAQQVAFIGEHLRLARLLSPSIVVIEDIDLIARRRQEMGSPLEEVLLNQLLNEMDGLREGAEILFVLTTNHPELLETALTSRPGRIDQAIEFPLPDADGRRKLARLYGRGVPMSAATLEHVVDRTDRVSASFIKELMRRAAQFALERGGANELAIADVDAALDELLFSGGRLNAALLGAAGALPQPS